MSTCHPAGERNRHSGNLPGQRELAKSGPRLLLVILAVLLVPLALHAAESALTISLEGPIGPATANFVIRSIEHAETENAQLLVIVMDTPGGLDTSTREIVKAILNAPLPVVTFIAPEGARAASAGTYILYASHVAAMSPATNVGAATPVSLTGGQQPRQPGTSADGNGDAEQTPESSGNPKTTDAMSRKAVNDAAAYARSLADKHGRNADWVETAVREAASIPAQQALELGVIDLVAENVQDLLRQINGREVQVLGQTWVINTEDLLVSTREPDWQTELLSVITSPTIAYILLLVGMYGLVLEGYNPGAIVPGVVGAISLLLALYALQMLPVNYAGFGLIALGLILMIAEVVAPSFGALGIGGIIALVFGSIMLIDVEAPGFEVSRPLIGAIALVGGVGMLLVISLAIKARARPLVAGREQLIGATGTALIDFDHEGFVLVHGERWQARTESELRCDDPIIVKGIDGLTLIVGPAGQVKIPGVIQ